MPNSDNYASRAARMTEAQIIRFVKSGMDAEAFLNQPYELEITAEVIRLQKKAYFARNGEITYGQ